VSLCFANMRETSKICLHMKTLSARELRLRMYNLMGVMQFPQPSRDDPQIFLRPEGEPGLPADTIAGQFSQGLFGVQVNPSRRNIEFSQRCRDYEFLT